MAGLKLVCEGDNMGECNPSSCSVHEYVISAMERFEKMSEKLADGQQQLQLNVVKLTENLDNVERAHERIDKQDERLSNIEKNMYKTMGVLGFLAIVIPVIINMLH